MGKIHVLDQNVSELIAAGEVIERPASIVKELLENSLDANATAVTIEIKNGGIDFIRITDNGIGFEKDDAAIAFFRHATSKVSSKNDLDSIATLGFRGEALASIAAVTRIELVTNTGVDDYGIKISINGGKLVGQTPAGCPVGTTIIVRNLFYNIPARLKFLKKATVESNSIQSIVEKIAISHPNVSFKLIRDNKQVLHTAGDGKLISSIYAVLGKEFASSLIEVDYEYQGVKIKGYITKPSFSRNNRSMQHFFVNDRYVKSRTCLTALEEGYKNSIMVGKFPGCVLMLGIDYSQVDVNVHPAKIEIRFADEKNTFEAVYFAIKTALSSADILKSSVNELKTFQARQVFPVDNNKNIQLNMLNNPRKSGNSFAKMSTEQYNAAFKQTSPENHSMSAVAASTYSNRSLSAATKSALYPRCEFPIHENVPPSRAATNAVKIEPEKIASPVKVYPALQEESKAPLKFLEDSEEISFIDESSFKKKEEPEQQVLTQILAKPDENDYEPVMLKFIGELFKTYILFEANDMFIMLDKHAAHERMLFEQLKRSVNLKEHQLLIAPLPVMLSTEEIGIVEENQQVFFNFGFTFDFSHAHSVRVCEAPLILHTYNLTEIVQDIVANIKANKMDASPECFENLLHSIACKMAIKANMHNANDELKSLAEQVYLDNKIRHCPHGRPVGITMTKAEIERKFGRI